jgi:hypothetical protein
MLAVYPDAGPQIAGEGALSTTAQLHKLSTTAQATEVSISYQYAYKL